MCHVRDQHHLKKDMNPKRRIKFVALTCLLGLGGLPGVQAATIPASAAIPDSAVDKTKPGFIWRVFANSANQVNGNARTESALAGQLKAADGSALPNLADPASVGVATAAGKAPSPANALIEFEIPTVINVNQEEGGAGGNFDTDGLMPGVPATDGSTDGIAVEVITYIELPAGDTKMGVDSDDAFKTTAGAYWDPFLAVSCGLSEGSQGTPGTIFTVTVEKAGIYPFRTIYEEGGGGAFLEWFTVKADDTYVLLNDTANGGLKAYRSANITLPPHVQSVNPPPGPRQSSLVGSKLEIVLVDGTSVAVDDASIALKVDGTAVTVSKVRTGKSVTVTYTPADVLLLPSDLHTAELSFNGTSSSWQFMNLKNIVLPEPKFTENFDSYAEGTQPTGWKAYNHSSRCTAGEDPADQTSDSFMNWVVISTNNVQTVDGDRVFNVAPGQLINGKPVVTLMSGNVLYAESDGRCNSDSDGGTNAGQAQFIETKAYDCSQFKGVVLSFSSLYEQNQDSLGGVEYSVDGGTNWLPIVYFLDSPDIVTKADGTYDAVATFNNKNDDTANWEVDGVAKGDNYGAGLAAPITADLAAYISPRVNDDSTEGKRVEVFSLPKAAGKSDVRIRFAQLGTDSWYFGIDNFALYDVAAAPESPELLDFQFNEGQGTTTTDAASKLIGTFGAGTNAPAWVTSSPSAQSGDTAVSFGTAKQIVVQDPTGKVKLDPADASFTMQAWINIAGNPSTRQVFYFNNGPGGALSFSIFTDRTLFVTTLGIKDQSSKAAVPDDGKWHHVAVVHENKKEFRFYVDGALADTQAYTSGVNFTRTNQVFYIGSEPTFGLQFTGQLDRLKVTKGILTPDQLDSKSGAVAGPGLSIDRAGTGLSITFEGTLEGADAVIGPWTAVPGTSPLSVTPTGATKFYRSKK